MTDASSAPYVAKKLLAPNPGAARPSSGLRPRCSVPLCAPSSLSPSPRRPPDLSAYRTLTQNGACES